MDDALSTFEGRKEGRKEGRGGGRAKDKLIEVGKVKVRRRKRNGSTSQTPHSTEVRVRGVAESK